MLRVTKVISYLVSKPIGVNEIKFMQNETILTFFSFSFGSVKLIKIPSRDYFTISGANPIKLLTAVIYGFL